MEEHQKSGDNKFITRKAEIAAAGNRPEDWRAYVEETKLNIKDHLFQEKRKYDIISYMYHSAFQGIPVSNTSLAHAQLLVDYATFKSDHSLEDAEKLLFHGRKYLRMHAIIHVASADLELRKGNRDKAATILKRGSHFGAKPECMIREAKDRLGRNCTRLLRGDSKENESFDSTSGYNSSSSSGVELTGESCQPQLKNIEYGLAKDGHSINLPGCKSSTEEVQHGLDLISQNNKLSSSTSTPSLLPSSTYVKREKDLLLSQQHQNTAKLNTSSKGACNPGSRLFQDLMNTHSSNHRKHDNTATDPMFGNFDLSCDDQFPSQHTSSVVGSLTNDGLLPQRTPQTSGLNPSSILDTGNGTNQGSAVKFHRWHSASALQESNKRPTAQSKGKLFNLPPPQRVRVDQSSNTSSEESDSEEKRDTDLKNRSSTVNKVDMSSSSLTFGTDRLPRMHSKIPPLPSSSKKGPSSFQLITPLSSKKGHTGEAHCEESHITEANKDGTSKVHKGIFASARSEEKMSVCEPVNPSSSSERGQHQVPSQTPSHKDVQYRENDSRTNPLSVFQEKISSCNTRLPPSAGGKNERASPQKNFPPGDEFRKNVMSAVTPDPLTAGYQPNGNEAFNPKPNEPHKATATVGATYSVPCHSQNQGVPKNMVTPAKQTAPGGQKTLYVKGKPYIVIKLIGRGGSAKVYQVQDPETLSMRALKCVNLSCVSKEVLEGYKNEIALLEKLQHCDRVIKLFNSEYVESQRKLLVVMECGETNLADFIAQNAKNKDELHSVTICYLWGHMVKAVQAMHKEGVIHSDLKPANFLLVSGTIKLIDFGIANSLQHDKTSVLKNHVMGTPNYMSPEALMASNADPSESKPKYKVGTRSDVWSLGCILYQMVYGHTPFQHVGFNLKLHAIVNPAHEIQFPPLEDAALMDILKICLTRDVKHRPTTDDLMNHPYLTKQKLAKPSHPSRQNLMEIEDISSASPRTQREYYLKKAEEFQTMASSLVSKMEHKDLTYNK